ncbi:MAG: tyrosine--tRNA ligase [Pseudomonadota bacterium]
MRAHRSEFIQAVVERGFLHQATDLDALDQLAASKRLTAYIGFDATADSLHVGNLVGIMMLRLLQRTGHRPIALVGGGTSKVGDPSGKEESRQLLTDEKLAVNLEGIKRSLSSFLDVEASDTGKVNETGRAGLMVNNADWLDHLNYIQLLRDYGPHFTINRMLTFDSVKLRLDREQPLTFLEFNYMIMQAYDFVELARRYDCELQMGGSDQWGNIVNGVELGRRVERRTLFGLTTPLITTASGAKMGKSAAGAIWLNKERLSDFEYWQYWRNTEDADVGRFLKLFTDLPLDEIAKLEALQGSEINEAKKILALEATSLCRGRAAAEEAAGAAGAVFGSDTESLEGLPTVEIDNGEFQTGINILDLLQRAGLDMSKGEARRLIRGGGARLNDDRISNEDLMVKTDDLQDGVLKISSGKKRHIRILAA